MSPTWTTRTKSGPGETRWHCCTALLGDGARLERGHRLGRLAVERDLDDRREAVAERLGREQGDPALDHAAFDELLDSPEAGRGRHVDARGQGVIGQRGVHCEHGKDLQVCLVERLIAV